VKIEARATVQDLKRVEGDILAAARQILGQLAALALAHAKATDTFKDRSGKLRSSIQRGQKSTWAHFVSAGSGGAKYALWIEAGSKPHPIVARRANFLRYEQGGVVKFRKRVFHPGTKPARFMQSARNASEALAEQYLESGINAAIRR
jgi:hypothetical protein